MNNGNAHQSKWSADFHAARGDVNAMCPAAEFGGHEGICSTVHPVGITLQPAGGWKATPVGDGWSPGYIESYA